MAALGNVKSNKNKWPEMVKKGWESVLMCFKPIEGTCNELYDLF